MKLKYILLPFIATAFTISSCSDFLDRKPLTDNVDDGFFTEPIQLQAYCNKKYELLPDYKDINLFTEDQKSDNQAGDDPEDLFLPQRIKVASDGSYNRQEHLRDCNHFLHYTLENVENGTLEDNKETQQYIGEMFFFRAYIYFEYLRKFGDFPIIKDELIADNYAANVEANKRKPRNEVARFILGDLDEAINRLLPRSNTLTKHRLNQESALLFKSRVALYEASWETYHQGTARVPGGPGWPGANKDYLKDFTINIDSEIKYFLTEAKTAAQIVADKYTLFNDYPSLFNSQSLANASEVLLWRAYDASLTPAVNHFVVGYIQRNGGGNTGWTRSMMQSYLMENGLPIYANNSGYQGDKTYEAVATNRDPRLTYNTLLPGDLLSEGGSNIEYLVKGYGYYYRAPIVLGQDENKCPTGYSVKKGLATDAAQGPTLPSTTACVIFRAAEAYLNYMEADYELNNSLDANSSKYWKALRNRAGMDTDFQKTIDATDLSKEIDFARYSGSEFVSTTLYNIRRERRIEFAAEGLRLNDLKRWRALDMMQGYHVEGFDLWSENYQRYKTPSPIPVADVTLSVINLIESGNNNANVSAKSESQYLRPYRINTNNIAYNGYNWNQNKYLNPIAFDHFRLTTAEEGSTDYTTSTIYQNPGWKIETSSLPEGD